MCPPHGVSSQQDTRRESPGSELLVSVENVVGLIVAVCLVGYLVAALIRPEKF